MKKTWLTVLALGAGALGLAWWGSGRVHQDAPPADAGVAVPPGVGDLVIDLVDGSTDADLAAIGARLGAPARWVHELARDEALAVATVPDLAAALAALQADPRVEVAEPMVGFSLDPAVAFTAEGAGPAAGFPNDPLYPKQWHLRRMGAPAAWAAGATGAGVVVAVVDTGVSPVEDLEASRILPGASFVPGVASPLDDQGHGTHVAGTIAQSTHNGVGVAGVAPQAKILPIKVLSAQGFGQSAWIAAGIDHAVDQGAQVINLSLGGGYSDVIHLAIKKARRKGVIVVAAAGNSGRRGVSWPGALTEVIGVGAIGPAGDRAPYSSWGPGVDLVAPGGDTRVTDGGVLQDTVGPGGKGHRYAAFQGTSMATPHVAGAAAALLSRGLSPDRVEDLLLGTARGGASEERGRGELDLAASLSWQPATSNLLRFGLGLAAAWLLASLAGKGRLFRPLAAVTGALSAGGMAFLSWIPGATSAWMATGWLELPAALGAPSWVHFPLWASALVPGFLGLLAGSFRGGRALGLGLNAGVGVHLFHAAATGEIQPWWLGTTFGPVWLAGNATLAVLVAMSLAGAEKLDREAR